MEFIYSEHIEVYVFIYDGEETVVDREVITLFHFIVKNWKSD